MWWLWFVCLNVPFGWQLLKQYAAVAGYRSETNLEAPEGAGYFILFPQVKTYPFHISQKDLDKDVVHLPDFTA